MQVAPVDLRAVRQNGMVVRYALLGSMTYALAEIPSSGTAGTSLERPCVDAHWGFVIEGELRLVRGRQVTTVTAGRAFHVPEGGPEHHFESRGAALVAGFQPSEAEASVSEDQLAARGFEIITPQSMPTIVPPMRPRRVARGEIRTESWRMSSYVLTRAQMGEQSGYTSGWCDAPHWGLVTAGRFAIEWEDDVEILSVGDVFHCPAGPPGHRLEAADPAAFIDLTPVAAIRAGGRVAHWRRETQPSERAAATGIAVAALG